MIYFPSPIKIEADKTIEKQNSSITYLSLTQLEEQGIEAHIGLFSLSPLSLSVSLCVPSDEAIEKQRPKKDDLAVIMYTSGSTGTPKGERKHEPTCSILHSLVRLIIVGVLIKHENVVAAMAGQKERVFPMVDLHNDIYIAYLPLAHILELCCGE